MIDHIWRERVGLADRLMRLGPQRPLAFAAVCALERGRRATIAGLKSLRDRVRVAPSKSRHRLLIFVSVPAAIS